MGDGVTLVERAFQMNSAKTMTHAVPRPPRSITKAPPTFGSPSSLAVEPDLEGAKRLSFSWHLWLTRACHQRLLSACSLPFSCSRSIAEDKRLRYGDPAAETEQMKSNSVFEGKAYISSRAKLSQNIRVNLSPKRLLMVQF